jgi:hypothetical protein
MRWSRALTVLEGCWLEGEENGNEPCTFDTGKRCGPIHCRKRSKLPSIQMGDIIRVLFIMACCSVLILSCLPKMLTGRSRFAVTEAILLSFIRFLFALQEHSSAFNPFPFFSFCPTRTHRRFVYFSVLFIGPNGPGSAPGKRARLDNERGKTTCYVTDARSMEARKEA